MQQHLVQTEPDVHAMTYSIVIPIYNEADNILPLIEEIEWVMQPLKERWEIIFIDDGSSDNSLAILQKQISTKPYLRCVQLKKNYGQTSAFAAGIKAAKGTWIISLDGDGQNDPRDIPLLIDIAKSTPNIDLVAGQRHKRKDPWHKLLIGKIANKVRRSILDDKTQDTGCSLKMYRKACFDQIPLYTGMHRFLPALFQIAGFQTKEVAVHHRQRKRGKSKYHLFNRGFSLLFDLLAVAWMRKRRLVYQIESEIRSEKQPP